MATLDGARIFSVAGTEYVWDDIVLAAHLWGEWKPVEQRVRDGLACLARLDDLDDDGEEALDEDEVDAEATDFRYARDLVAAADLETWLDARGITVDAWLDFIRGTMLVSRWADELDEIRDAYELDADEVADAMRCDIICSGLARALAERLAARAAIHARLLDESAVPGVDADAVATAATLACDDALGRALPALSPDRRRARLRSLSEVERAWQHFAARLAPPEALRKTLTAHQLDWIRFTVQTVTAANDELAREIALCVREDGRPIADVASDAGLSCETAVWWLDDVDPAVHDALVVAQPGDVVGPVSAKSGHLVLTVSDKRLPSDADPAVRVRAERALLGRTVEHEVANRVTWHRTL